ncbi:hypothetical protein LUZ60_002993 [Juncus effusus]|nr:hypothetical protein LUZ60_002993 [Juncus effusus]
MAARKNSRRLSLDLFLHRATSDLSTETSIFKYMDLRLPNETLTEMNCDCCGLSEECTRSYAARVKSLFCGRWVCGLCSEAIKEELVKLGLGPHVVREEAVSAHLEVCKRFNKSVKNPAMSLAGALIEILKRKKNVKRGGGARVERSYSDVPFHHV